MVKDIFILGSTGSIGLSTLKVLKNEKKNFQIKLLTNNKNVKKISIKEKRSLNILCRGAAMRYFLTRLYDYTNTPKTALIKIKDPRKDENKE